MMNQSKYTLEVCAATIESATNAQKAGAGRIELCSALSEGGLTPSIGLIKQTKKLLSIGIHVLIRPRSGDFLYSENEFEIIKQDVIACKEIGVEGVVVGILKADGTIDKERMSQLVEIAKPMSITFHRAFDMCANLSDALEDVISLGCDRILTSGGGVSAINTIKQLKLLVAQANDRIVIMPGAGINHENISIIAKGTNAIEFHASARTKVHSKMIFRNNNANMGSEISEGEYTTYESGYEQIKQIVDVLEEL